MKLKLYVSHGEQAMPVQLRSFAQRVDDLVAEFKSVAGGKLIVEKYDPEARLARPRTRRSWTASSRSSSSRASSSTSAWR